MASGSRMDGNGNYVFWDWPAANVDAVVYLPPAGDKMRWVISQVDFGFDAIPASPVDLEYQLAAQTANWKVPVDDSGPRTWRPAGQVVGGEPNASVTIKLPAGGAAVTGKLNVLCKKDFAP